MNMNAKKTLKNIKKLIYSDYTESPAEAEFVCLTAGVGTIHLFV